MIIIILRGKRQDSYRAPFIWVQINLLPNTLVNIRCRATALNINNDRGDRTEFSLFIIFNLSF